jgi:hypothetical protein
MLIKIFAFSVLSAASALAQISPVPPPPRPPLSDLSFEWQFVSDTGQSWKTGDAAEVVRVHNASAKNFGQNWTSAKRMFWRQWIAALVQSDAAAAQNKLDEWIKSDPATSEVIRSYDWETQRQLLQAQIFLAQGKSELAIGLAKSIRTEIDMKRIILALSQHDKKLPVHNLAQAAALATPTIVESVVALATQGPASKALALQASDNAMAPYGAVFLPRQLESPGCEVNDQTPDDWALLSIRFISKKLVAEPVAQSRPNIYKPYILAIYEGGYEATTRHLDIAGQYVFLRCTRKLPTPSVRSKYEIDLFNFAEARSPNQDNRTYSPATLLEVQAAIAASDLLTLIEQSSQVKTLHDSRETNIVSDAAVIGALKILSDLGDDGKKAKAIFEFMQLHKKEKLIAEEGATTRPAERAKAAIALYENLLKNLRADPHTDFAMLSWIENEIALKHRVAGDLPRARALYRGVISRVSEQFKADAPEVIVAQLGLAAIAESEKDSRTSEAIIQALGLNPEQCSIYQDSPTLTEFKLPDYPSAIKNQRVQGYVKFEFDLDTLGKAGNFRILASTPPFVFESLTVDSFTKAQFLPVTRGGGVSGCDAAVQSFVWKLED